MPHVQINSLKGRSWREVNEILNATQRTVLSVFKVPLHDQYQEYAEHTASNMIVKSKGSGSQRKYDTLFFTVITTPCSEEIKRQFYVELCRELKSNAFINVRALTLLVLTTSASAEGSASAVSDSTLEVANPFHPSIPLNNRNKTTNQYYAKRYKSSET